MDYPLLINAKPIDDYKLVLTFKENETRMYDFKPNLNHKYYNQLSDFNLFKNVSVENGQIEWLTGQDFCPHTLYDKSIPYQL
jgi:hypothetical protein